MCRSTGPYRTGSSSPAVTPGPRARGSRRTARPGAPLAPRGTAGIVASVVPVNDQATAKLMVPLHRYLRDGASLAEALRLPATAPNVNRCSPRPHGRSSPSAPLEPCEAAAARLVPARVPPHSRGIGQEACIKPGIASSVLVRANPNWGAQGRLSGTPGCPESLARPRPAAGANVGRCARMASPAIRRFGPAAPSGGRRAPMPRAPTSSGHWRPSHRVTVSRAGLADCGRTRPGVVTGTGRVHPGVVSRRR